MYIVPQVTVHQEFSLIPDALTDPLRAFIAGPNYELFRYSSEKDLIGIGKYDPYQQQSYIWPNRTAGSVVDESYVRLFVDNALLRYYTNDTGGAGDEIYAVSSNTIRSESAGVNFVQTYNADGTVNSARATALKSRDVKVGDVIRVYGIGSGASVEIWTYVAGLIPEVIASSYDADATGADGNQATVAADFDVAQPVGSSFTWSESASNDYDGCVDGAPEEVYTCRVIKAGPLGTAKVTITSASGTDDVAETTLLDGSGDVTPTAIGTRGCYAAITGSGDFVLDDEYVVTVKQAFTAPTVDAVVASDYTGTQDTTYIVTVTQGREGDGSDSDEAKIVVTTTNGYDSSGPHVITADNIDSGGSPTAVAIGQYGIQIVFTTATKQLSKGDKYYIGAYAESAGAYKTIKLGHDLPSTLRPDGSTVTYDGSSSSSETADVGIELYIKKDMELPKNKVDGSGVNFSTSGIRITVEPGAVGYDATFYNESTLALEPMELMPGESTGIYSEMYVQYRALLQAAATSIQSIDSVADVTDALGTIDPDNPLALAVFLALSNSTGTAVKYMAVPTNDLDGYSEVVEKLVGRKDVYGLVPLSKLSTIQTLFAAHVDEMSSPENGRWRICLLNSDADAATAVVDADTAPAGIANEATIVADSENNGEFTLVSWPSGNFAEAGAAAGDIYRTNYGTESEYEEYVIDEVINETSLRLVAGPDTAVDVAIKFEVWHNNTKSEVASEYATKSGSFSSSRVYHIWPDKIEYGSEQIEGYYAAAAVAGLVSGVVPQQGLTNLGITGFTAVTRSTDYMNATQLNTMAEAGTFVITQDEESGEIHSRHQLSTDTTDLNTKELSVVKNVDSISYLFLNRLAPYIGIANVTPSFLAKLKVEFIDGIDYLKNNGYVARLGGQLIDASIAELRPHTLLKDRVVAVLDLEIPYPVNNIEVHLVV